MTEGAQNLAQQIQEQAVNSAKDYYGNALGEVKGQLESSRAELEGLLEQLPEGQEEARAQIQELIDSYESIENSLDELEVAARAVEVFAERLLDDLAGVHHAHRDVLDVFLVRGFDLLVRHSSPRRRVVGANGSSSSRAARGRDEQFLGEHRGIREDDCQRGRLASNAQVTSEPGNGVR